MPNELVPKNGERSPVLRSADLSEPRSIREWSEVIRREDPLHINLLSKALTHKSLYEHVALIGSSGSGKSLTMNHLLHEMLAIVGAGYGQRIFIWDFKRNARNHLEAIPLAIPVHYLDPIDKRSVGIDWAAEIDSPPAATQFAAEVLYPDAKPAGDNYAFIENARTALAHVIETFQERAKHWDLTDVVEACISEDNLKAVFSRTRRGRLMTKTVFGTKGQNKGIFFSLNAFAKTMGPIAYALSKVPASRRITLRTWFKEESVLVLGHNHRFRRFLAPFQRWVFGVLKDTLISEPDIAHDGTERTAFFLDEVRNSPFLTHITELANSGRSKGAAIVAGLGGVSGLQAAIGDKLTEEFLEMFRTKAFLRMDGASAEWASRYFNKYLRVANSQSEGESFANSVGFTYPQHSHSRNVTRTSQTGSNWQASERTVLYPGDFRTLMPATNLVEPGVVVSAYVCVQEFAWKEVATHMEKCSIIPKAVVEHQPREGKDFGFGDGWGPDDFKRLDITQVSTETERKADEPSDFEKTFRVATQESVGGPSNDEDDEDDDGADEASQLARLGIIFTPGRLDDISSDLDGVQLDEY